MGEAAEDMLDGSCCETCGEWFHDGDAPGYPRPCNGCKQPVRQNIERWFLFNNSPRGNGTALNEFLSYVEFDGFSKGKRDKTGKLVIFLQLQGVAVGAVRCEEQFYQSALNKLKEALVHD